MLSTKTHALSFSLPLLSFSFSLLIKVFHPSLSFASCTFIVMIIIIYFFFLIIIIWIIIRMFSFPAERCDPFFILTASLRLA